MVHGPPCSATAIRIDLMQWETAFVIPKQESASWLTSRITDDFHPVNCFRAGIRAKDIKLKRKTVRKHPILIVKKKKTVRKHPSLIVKKKKKQ